MESRGPPPPPPAPPGLSAVVHRTQVLLLSGEPGAPQTGQAVLGSFAHRVLTPDSSGPPCPPVPLSSPSAQLVFFVVRWGSLRERPGPVKEALRGLLAQVGGSPATALVGVVVQPPPSREEEALRLLEGALEEVFFQGEGGTPEVHAALFAPGGPQGALRLRRMDPHRGASAATARTPRAFWKDKTVMMQILGAVVSLGTMVYSSYYFYNHPPL